MGFNWGGAASGASAGSAAGPWGALAGGVLGGFLGGDEPSMPKPPDYGKIAAKERQWNKAMYERQLRELRRDQTGPTGTIRYDDKGNQTTKLTPELQRNLNLQTENQRWLLNRQGKLIEPQFQNERDRLRYVGNAQDLAAKDYRGEMQDAAGARDYRGAARDTAMELLPEQEDLWRGRAGTEGAYQDYLMGKIKSGQKLTDDEQRAFQGRLSTEQAARQAQKGWYDFQSGALPSLEKMYGDISGKLGDLTGKIGGGPELGAFDPNYAAQLGDQMYGSVMSRLAPEQARAEADMTTRLRQQGLQPGTEAFDRAMRNLLTSQGDVRSKAALDAQAAAWGEARARRGLDINAYQAQLEGAMQPWEQMQSAAGALGGFSEMFQPADYRAGAAPGADTSLLLKAGAAPSYQSGLGESTNQMPWYAQGGWNPDPGSVITSPSFPGMPSVGAPPNYNAGTSMDAARGTAGWNLGNYNQATGNYGDWQNAIAQGIGGLADWWNDR